MTAWNAGRGWNAGLVTAAVVVTVGSAGCEPAADGTRGDAVVRDSAGIEIVEVGRLEAPDRWRLEPLWDVGEVEGEPLFGIGDGFGVEVPTRFLDGERIGVVESGGGRARVHVLDAATGAHRATVGRQGEGPGEFVAPRGLVATDGGGFVVWDTRLRRVTRWNGELELLGSEPLPDLGVVGLPDLHPSGEGLWIWLSSQLGPPEPDQPVRRDEGVLAHWSGSVVDTITRFPGLEYVANGSFMGSPPWGDRSVSAPHPDGIWLGDTDEPAVRLFRRGGLARIVRWEAEPTPRTAGDDALFLRLIEEKAPPNAPPQLMEQMQGLLVVDRKPYWGRILAGEHGRLWVSPTLDMGLPADVVGPAPERRWVVLGGDGAAIAELTTPEGFVPGDVRDDVVVGIERDALGVERVRAFRIVRDAADGPAPATAGCTDCVQLDSVATLDFTGRDFLPSPRGLLASDPTRPRWAYVDRRFPARIVVFGPDGVSEVGREGDGPGEFREIDDVRFDASGELVVLHRAGTRIRRYSADLEDLESISEHPIDGRTRAIRPLSDTRLYIVRSDSDGVETGVWSPEAGFDPTPVDLAAADPLLVLTATDLDDTAWVVEPHTFRVWEVSGAAPPRVLVDASPPWFGEGYRGNVLERLEQVGADTGGTTALAIRHDPDSDLLWMIFGVPSATLSVDEVDRILAGETELLPRMADHVIAAVSTSDGSIRATGRFDHLVLGDRDEWLYDIVGTDVVVVRAPVRISG